MSCKAGLYLISMKARRILPELPGITSGSGDKQVAFVAYGTDILFFRADVTEFFLTLPMRA